MWVTWNKNPTYWNKFRLLSVVYTFQFCLRRAIYNVKYEAGILQTISSSFQQVEPFLEIYTLTT